MARRRRGRTKNVASPRYKVAAQNWDPSTPGGMTVSEFTLPPQGPLTREGTFEEVIWSEPVYQPYGSGSKPAGRRARRAMKRKSRARTKNPRDPRRREAQRLARGMTEGPESRLPGSVRAKKKRKKKKVAKGALARLSVRELKDVYREQYGERPPKSMRRKTLEERVAQKLCEQGGFFSGAVAAVENAVGDVADAITSGLEEIMPDDPKPRRRRRRKKASTSSSSAGRVTSGFTGSTPSASGRPTTRKQLNAMTVPELHKLHEKVKGKKSRAKKKGSLVNAIAKHLGIKTGRQVPKCPPCPPAQNVRVPSTPPSSNLTARVDTKKKAKEGEIANDAEYRQAVAMVEGLQNGITDGTITLTPVMKEQMAKLIKAIEKYKKPSASRSMSLNIATGEVSVSSPKPSKKKPAKKKPGRKRSRRLAQRMKKKGSGRKAGARARKMMERLDKKEADIDAAIVKAAMKAGAAASKKEIDMADPLGFNEGFDKKKKEETNKARRALQKAIEDTQLAQAKYNKLLADYCD